MASPCPYRCILEAGRVGFERSISGADQACGRLWDRQAVAGVRGPMKIAFPSHHPTFGVVQRSSRLTGRTGQKAEQNEGRTSCRAASAALACSDGFPKRPSNDWPQVGRTPAARVGLAPTPALRGYVGLRQAEANSPRFGWHGACGCAARPLRELLRSADKMEPTRPGKPRNQHSSGFPPGAWLRQRLEHRLGTGAAHARACLKPTTIRK